MCILLRLMPICQPFRWKGIAPVWDQLGRPGVLGTGISEHKHKHKTQSLNHIQNHRWFHSQRWLFLNKTIYIFFNIRSRDCNQKHSHLVTSTIVHYPRTTHTSHTQKKIKLKCFLLTQAWVFHQLMVLMRVKHKKKTEELICWLA